MKALFIGLGSIGQRHLRNLRRLVPEVELAAARNSRSVPLLDDENKVILHGDFVSRYSLKEFSDVDEALKWKPDIVFIANPTSKHADSCKKALEASDAFIFVEKPVTHELPKLLELIEVEKKSGKRRVMVGFQYRFNPILQHVKRLIDDKAIGNIVSALFINGEYMPDWHPYEDYRASYAARSDLGGGALLTQIHDFDYAYWLLGMPKALMAIGGKLSNLEIDVEDSIHVLMQCDPNNRNLTVPVTILLDYLRSPPDRSCILIGDCGKIHCNLILNTLDVYKLKEKSSQLYRFQEFNRNEMFISQLRNFLAFVKGEQIPPVGLLESVISLELVLAAKRSYLKLKPVFI